MMLIPRQLAAGVVYSARGAGGVVMALGDEIIDIVSGDLLEQQVPLSLAELCQDFAVETAWVVELVEVGILEPEGRQQEQWRFSGECRRCISIVRRLQ